MTDREIMQQALDALEIAEVDGNCCYEATELLRTLLTQPTPTNCRHCPDEPPQRTEQEPVDLEALASAVHDAYLNTCDKLSWGVKLENRVPYSELTENSKELDRASVRAVLRLVVPQPQRKPLTDEQATKIVQGVTETSPRPIGAVELGLLVLRAAETAHNIKESI